MAMLVSTWSNNVETVPANYIMPPEKRPGKSIEVCKEIPVIDLGLAGENSRAGIVQQIMKASQEFGIFQVINHGVSKDIIKEAKTLYTELFQMSSEDKAIFPQTFLTLNAVSTQVVGRYAVEVRKLGLKILELIGEGLGLQDGYFDGELTQSHDMSINYYPPCPDPTLAMGIDAHRDSPLFSLLEQNVAGLQILKDGKWIGVEAIPNAFVVNGGCQLEIISNGKFKSVEHRGVTNLKVARLSIVTFLGPSFSTVVEPAKDIVAAGETPKFKASLYGDFMRNYFAHLAKKGPPNGTPLDPYKL